MMTNLQQVGVRRFLDQKFLDALVRIAHQQRRGCRRTACAAPATRRPARDRAPASPAADSTRGYAGPPKSKTSPACMRRQLHMERTGRLLHVLESAVGRFHSIPELARLKVRDDAAHSAHVIAVRVRKRDRIQTANPARPQIRRDDLFANIEVGVRRARHAACIQQQRLALRRDQQQRVALADIDGGDLEDSQDATAAWAETARSTEPMPATRRRRAIAKTLRRASTSAMANVSAAKIATARVGVGTRTSEMR